LVVEAFVAFPSNGKSRDIRRQRHTCISVIHRESLIKLSAWISSCKSRWVCAPVGCTCCRSRFVVVAVKALWIQCTSGLLCVRRCAPSLIRAGTAGAKPLSARRESRPRHAHVITSHRRAGDRLRDRSSSPLLSSDRLLAEHYSSFFFC
jgi:hypothetical protein